MGCNYSFVSQLQLISAHGSIIISSENCRCYHLSMSYFQLIYVNKWVPMTLIWSAAFSMLPTSYRDLITWKRQSLGKYLTPDTDNKAHEVVSARSLACHFCQTQIHDHHNDVIKWKHFPPYWPYWPFVRVIHWSPENSHHKGQWRGSLMFSLIYAWANG